VRKRLEMKDTEALLQSVAAGLDKVFENRPGDKTIGFALFVFPFGAPKGARTNYVSNAERADMVAALKEVLARFEGRHHEGGRA
jgi:predicted component of type VI protein secretion system